MDLDLKSEESESSMQREGTEQRAKGIVKCQQAAGSKQSEDKGQKPGNLSFLRARSALALAASGIYEKRVPGDAFSIFHISFL